LRTGHKLLHEIPLLEAEEFFKDMFAGLLLPSAWTAAFIRRDRGHASGQ
jgi:hypothetical protein